MRPSRGDLRDLAVAFAGAVVSFVVAAVLMAGLWAFLTWAVLR